MDKFAVCLCNFCSLVCHPVNLLSLFFFFNPVSLLTNRQLRQLLFLLLLFSAHTFLPGKSWTVFCFCRILHSFIHFILQLFVYFDRVWLHFWSLVRSKKNPNCPFRFRRFPFHLFQSGFLFPFLFSSFAVAILYANLSFFFLASSSPSCHYWSDICVHLFALDPISVPFAFPYAPFCRLDFSVHVFVSCLNVSRMHAYTW